MNFENYKNIYMKNLITVIALFFTFTIGAFAQDSKKEDPKILAKRELHSLTKIIDLDNSVAIGLNDLLIYKHVNLAKATSDKERNEVYSIMKSKIEGSLSPDQLKKLKSNKALYDNLIK